MNARVLVADDDAASLGLVSDALERLGCDVTRAEDGDELLQHLAAAGPFDLVVTDISMPWMTGLQVAHSARAAGLTTPVIVMTALPIDAARVTELGAPTVLLRKPFELKQLVAAARHMLRMNHAA
jgi:two-component system capsular synthesis sensor histidine kinase RcsC